ncbi:MAG: hypothetical protein ACK56F_30715, partial [bacterium]
MKCFSADHVRDVCERQKDPHPNTRYQHATRSSEDNCGVNESTTTGPAAKRTHINTHSMSRDDSIDHCNEPTGIGHVRSQCAPIAPGPPVAWAARIAASG